MQSFPGAEILRTFLPSNVIFLQTLLYLYFRIKIFFSCSIKLFGWNASIGRLQTLPARNVCSQSRTLPRLMFTASFPEKFSIHLAKFRFSFQKFAIILQFFVFDFAMV